MPNNSYLTTVINSKAAMHGNATLQLNTNPRSRTQLPPI